ncbi:tRNA preQ1(34) S-adenosylmethionine ribosyltransferase-isomerase QueA [Geoalkalibacter halelectricus]|uniref:S-adenosylmethionine:tRNA ribosyltransferase-isomerase n=1 Tax=Geoalkalibacter halelectricus TaxID=2847045 RepID=A0ABY5ZIH5_9BACT|nr:tRNA preQ1(34) S-adenosylmethionine ribosyltransferase-isomerase QueA [Geoalkalibacter halelectricus]MDO3379424.1 tRNA preQ1(34) S-adenosylmethionine ribosyltransferase-isomerase QueA [Geoalkalibacter halelectricus]UWZ78699.1 tRNA preQ1(34) S-adenosylmethionine ribosyltransferase-isomerase QueA [Geoalkalibacter halelectricus]
MQLSNFDFELPEGLIAQHPAQRRDGSRLMTIERTAGLISSGVFTDVVDAFRPGDVLVINDTRVIPARLLGRKESGGRIEVFLVRRLQDEEETWLCLTRSSKPARPGTRLVFDGGLRGEILEDAHAEPGQRRVRFAFQGDFMQVLEEVGHIPLPPYIDRADQGLDRDRYQTVFAREPGAVAAPTAGLHFTEDVLRQLRERGVEILPLTLHVGPGTFLPVRVTDIRSHRMHAEHFRVSETTAAAVNQAKREGRRIFALGTTATRVLEYALDDGDCLVAGEGVSDLFIYPGFRFRMVNALITNFHLPRSTLLMLVCAFAGQDLTLAAYRRAVVEKFRFFSYGDCMLIL